MHQTFDQYRQSSSRSRKSQLWQKTNHPQKQLGIGKELQY